MTNTQTTSYEAYKMRLYFRITLCVAGLLLIAFVWAFVAFKNEQNALEVTLNEKNEAQKELEIALVKTQQMQKMLEFLTQNAEFLSQKAQTNENTLQNLSNSALTNSQNIALNSQNSTSNSSNLSHQNLPQNSNSGTANAPQNSNSGTANAPQNLNSNDSQNLNLQDLNSQQTLNSNASNAQEISLTPKKAKPKIRFTEMNASKLEAEFTQKAELKTALNLAHLHLENKDYEKALQWSFKANAMDKNEPKAWLIYAKAKFALGKKDEAKRVLQGFMKHYPQGFDEDVSYMLQ